MFEPVVPGTSTAPFYQTGDGSRPPLQEAVRAFEEEINRSSAGSESSFSAIKSLVDAIEHPDGWGEIASRFKPLTAPEEMAWRLVLARAILLPDGERRARMMPRLRSIECDVAQVFGQLGPDTRADIVARWSDSEASSVYFTAEHLVAIGLPNTPFLCLLNRKGMSNVGLSLNQEEAVALLLARPEGEPVGATLLQCLSRPPLRWCRAAGHLLTVAMGPDAILPPELDSRKVYDVAAIVHDTMDKTHGPLALYEAFAKLFYAVGDPGRAAKACHTADAIRAQQPILKAAINAAKRQAEATARAAILKARAGELVLRAPHFSSYREAVFARMFGATDTRPSQLLPAERLTHGADSQAAPDDHAPRDNHA